MTVPGPLDIVVLGLSLRSSWGNGHATTYRALIGALQRAGDCVTFLERDVPWYRDNQDPAEDLPCASQAYADLDELRDAWGARIAAADLVIVGSYVPDGIAVGDYVLQRARGVTAFYDIDTPVTLAALANGGCGYLRADQIADYDVYFSFSGGRSLDILEQRFQSPMARPLYCSFDPARYVPEQLSAAWDLGYMGTYSDDRQPGLERLLLAPARALPRQRFVVAGPQYPAAIAWPGNVERIEHLAPAAHSSFYARQRFTLNLTRADMVRAGWSPSVRLFEAAACGTPIISDPWNGLDAFFAPGSEILITESADQVRAWLRQLSDDERLAIGARARARVLAEHTADHRAQDLHRAIGDARARHVATTTTRRISHDHVELQTDH